MDRGRFFRQTPLTLVISEQHDFISFFFLEGESLFFRLQGDATSSPKEVIMQGTRRGVRPWAKGGGKWGIGCVSLLTFLILALRPFQTEFKGRQMKKEQCFSAETISTQRRFSSNSLGDPRIHDLESMGCCSSNGFGDKRGLYTRPCLRCANAGLDHNLPHLNFPGIGGMEIQNQIQIQG